MVKNTLQPANKLKLSSYLTNDVVRTKINDIVGGENGQRFISSIVSTTTNNPQLQECRNDSILNAALLGESLKLSPSPQLGQYYLVPYKDKTKGMVAQFQMGYKGYIQLALRSNQYSKLNVEAVKEGELIEFDPFNEEIKTKPIKDPNERENAKTIGYYAMFEYTNGFRKAIYWSKEKMEAHALKYSQGYKADKAKGTSWTFWSKDFDSMAYKTMLRQLISKWGIMSIDMQNAFEKDMGIVKDDGQVDYIDSNTMEDEQASSDNTQKEEKPEHTKADSIKDALYGEQTKEE